MLRFKRDDGSNYSNWEKCKLGSLLSFKNGLNISKEKFGSGIKFISVLDILNNNYIDYSNIKGMVDIDQNVLNEFDVEYGDILFQRSSETRVDAGKSNVYLDKEKKATFGGFVIRGKKIGDYVPEFMNFCLRTSGVRKQIIRKAQGEQHVNIGQDILSNIEINLPCLDEQQKIADFLSEVDNIIAMSEQEIESLEMQKKGAMQKIFSQEVRFKADDGSEYPAWEEKKMDNICSFFSGGTPTSSNADYYGGEIPFIRSGEIHLASTELFITDIGLKASSAKMVNIGDILYALYGATSGEVDISKINGAINQAILCIRPDKYQSSIFIKELLNHNKDKIVKTFLQGGQGNLSAYTIKNLKYEFPCFEEQQKIADFLSEFDNAIEYAKEELEVWKNIKKGLLQQMFE